MYSPARKFTPMPQEKPVYYSNKKDLPGIAEQVIEGIKAAYTDDGQLSEGGICKIISAPPPDADKNYYHIGKEHDPEKSALDIRHAPIFFFGGLFNDSIPWLGPLPARLHNLVDPGRRESFNKALFFCPQSSRPDRIRAAYKWNADKDFPIIRTTPPKSDFTEELGPALANDLENFTNELWKNRFCDDKGRLLPSNQFNGFSFITYSIGGRLAFMVENMLRVKLRQTLRDRSSETAHMSYAEESRVIQSYFDKCKIISIGHAVDWREAPIRKPSIPKLFLIGREDEGVIPHKAFYDLMQEQDFGGKPAVSCDISDKFHAPPGSHTVIILDDGILESVKTQRSTSNMHGLGDYMTAVEKFKSDPNLKLFIDTLNAALTPQQEISRRLPPAENHQSQQAAL